MWYVYEVTGRRSEVLARYPTHAESEDYARQLRAERPRTMFTVVPSEEEAARIRDEQRRQKRSGH